MSLYPRHLRAAWERLALKNPYYAVLTRERFLAAPDDADARTSFFETGREDVESFLEAIRQHLDPSFVPHNVLEFGCGVGRLLLPLTALADHVVGVDVSESMLAEAARNLRGAGRTNWGLVHVTSGLDELVMPRCNFILSYIVFQHIRPKAGLRMMRRLVTLLEPHGVGAFHFTVRGGLGHVGRFLQRTQGGSYLLNAMEGRPLAEPVIEIHNYSMSDVLGILHNAGVRSVYLKLTNHGGDLGAIIFFQKLEVEIAVKDNRPERSEIPKTVPLHTKANDLRVHKKRRQHEGCA